MVPAGVHPGVGRLQSASAIRTQDVLLVGQEALAHQADVTAVAAEAIRMPMAVVERDELRTTKACKGRKADTYN